MLTKFEKYPASACECEECAIANMLAINMCVIHE